MVLLKSKDGLAVEVDETAALQSSMVKLALEKGVNPERGVDLEKVDGEVLPKVVEYMVKQAEFASKKPHDITEQSPELRGERAKEEKALKEWKEEVENWETAYIDVSPVMLYDLLSAACYMDIEGLKSLSAKKIAGMVHRMTAEEMREAFHIENDWTPEEEAAYDAKYPGFFS